WRPNDRYRRAFQSGSAWALVEPLRLDDVTLEGFIDAYGSSLDKFNEELRGACRNADGEYLPILVRLALFVTDIRTASVSELYRGAVRHLLKQQDKLVDAAVALCLETYWSDGERKLVFANAPEARKSELRSLWNAGLLIPADASMIPGEEPR